MIIGKTTILKPVLTGVACSLLWGTAPAQPDNEWLTMAGEGEMPYKTDQDLIQVHPQSIQIGPEFRTMEVRVNRNVQRTNWDGVPYRSYVSTVEVDCTKKTARYVLMHYYLTPVWSGPVYKTIAYPPQQLRMMAFRDVVPNPRERIVKAACLGTTIQHN